MRRKKKNRFPYVILTLLSIAIVIGIVFCIKIFILDNQNVSYSEIDYYEIGDDPGDTYEPVSKAQPQREVDVVITDNRQEASFYISDEEYNVICEYFKRYYVSLGRLSPESTDDLFATGAAYHRSLCEAVIYYITGVRNVMNVDLGFGLCNVGLNFTFATDNGTEKTVNLVVNDYVCFDYIPDITSYTCDVEHTFVLTYEDGKCVISEHSEISGAYANLSSAYNNYIERSGFGSSYLDSDQINGIFKSFCDDFIDDAVEDIKSLEGKRIRYNENPDKYKLKMTADNPYNAKDALNYSYKWTGLYEKVRNPDYYEYDNYGGNCNNFTSQCLHAGGIPMDTYGDISCQWKWYSGDINVGNTASGRSMSWTGVEEFCNYCINNKGFGLSCEVGGNIYSARVGDIIQYVSKDGKGVHSVIVSKVIYDENGNVVDLLINSNTTDKVDCPMITYGYTSIRVIRIVGWNDN
ncbi:MAG: amidase domain-containing protein [Clostridia bacterium]|nr:amidase domain-containing protein [Clostridia bacterium]